MSPELEELIKRLRQHVNSRGGASIENGAWSMMLKAADELERLCRLLEGRDKFIVENDLFDRFLKTLP